MSSTCCASSGKDLRHVHPALPVFAKLKRARHQRAGISLPHDDLALAGQRLAGIFLQRRLGVEGIQMADAAMIATFVRNTCSSAVIGWQLPPLAGSCRRSCDDNYII